MGESNFDASLEFKSNMKKRSPQRKNNSKPIPSTDIQQAVSSLDGLLLSKLESKIPRKSSIIKKESLLNKSQKHKIVGRHFDEITNDNIDISQRIVLSASKNISVGRLPA